MNLLTTIFGASWKTSVGGLLLALGGGLQLSSNPVAHTVGACLLAIGGLFTTQARDNKVTSEAAGATNRTPPA